VSENNSATSVILCNVYAHVKYQQACS